MSRENVEIARRATDAHNERDWDSFAGLITANIEWFPSMAAPSKAAATGGARGWNATSSSTTRPGRRSWSKTRTTTAAEDRVIAAGRLTASGRGSGVPVSTPVWTVFEFQAGKASRARVNLDAGEASRAAGAAE